MLVTVLSLQLSTAFAGDSIVGGQNVVSQSTIARRTVALFMVNKNNGGEVCSGSLINNSAVLTAAHCVRDVKAIFVVFAVSGVDKIVKDAFSQLVGGKVAPIGQYYRLANNFRQLPGYSGQTSGDGDFSDLGLVTFPGGIPAGYEPAQFLNQAEGSKFLRPGAPIIVAGYGITSVQERDHPVKGHDTSGTLRAVQLQFAQFSPSRKDMFLQGRPGHDACSGDSGGPAMVSVNGNVYIVGVASRSDCVSTSIYTWVPREKAARVAGFLQAM